MMKTLTVAAISAFGATAFGGVIAYSNWEPTNDGPGTGFGMIQDSAVYPDELGFNFVSLATGELDTVAIAASVPITFTNGLDVNLGVWSTDASGTPLSLLTTTQVTLLRRPSGAAATQLYVVEFDRSLTLEQGTMYSLVITLPEMRASVFWGATQSVAETLVYRTDGGPWVVQDPSVANATMVARIIVTPAPAGFALLLGGIALGTPRRR